MNDKVLASWSDCRFYPAKVIAVNKDGECCNTSFLCFTVYLTFVFPNILKIWRIICFIPAASYTVRFYDGVIQKVKGIHVKPFIKEV